MLKVANQQGHIANTGLVVLAFCCAMMAVILLTLCRLQVDYKIETLLSKFLILLCYY